MILIPMAGLSSRFTRAGYDKPKWKLPLAGRPLLDWTLLSFERLFESERFVISYLAGADTEAYIRERIEHLGIRKADLIPLSSPTRGQAETVHIAVESINANESEQLVIFNVDTIRPNCEIPRLKDGSLGLVECFRGEGEHWSFVRPDNERPGFAAEVVEKKRVSDLCSTGLYVFASIGDFNRGYELEINAPSSTELFVAPLYQKLIDAGGNVEYNIIDRQDVIFSGTPSEYEDVLAVEDTVPSAFA